LRKKENVNWVVNLNPKASTYNFAKAEVDLKDQIKDNLALGFLGLNLGKGFVWIIIVVESDMSNQDQQVAKELCFMWNMTTFGVPFVSRFCISMLQLMKPNTCFNKVHFHMGEREV